MQYFGDNLGQKVKAMPLVEETSLLEDSSVTLPVVVIGKLLNFISQNYSYGPYCICIVT